MKYAYIFSLITGFLTVSFATGQTDVYNCASLGTGCYMYRNSTDSPFICSCTEKPGQPHLADFYSRINYKGYQYQAHGPYSTCINLPPFWDQNSDSMISATDPPAICCLYTDLDCNTVGHASIQVGGDGAVADMIYPFDGTRSFRCSLWLGEGSSCTDSILRK